MKNAITVVLKNHPYARSYNHLGGANDIKTHHWLHINVKFISKPGQYEPILKAFSTLEPFAQLAWFPAQNCPTQTINQWTVRHSPVAREEGDSLWLAFECLNTIPKEFLQYIADKLQIRVRISYCPPYGVEWIVQELVPNIHK